MFKNGIIALERVQRRMTKLVPEFKLMSYRERLIQLKLPSLKFRQIRGDLIETFKIIHQTDNLTFSDFFSYVPTNKTTRNSNIKLQLFKEHAYSGTRNIFLSYRVNNYWNYLDENIRT